MKIEDTVARWREEEDAVRARLSATAGYARADQVNDRTGLETLEAIFTGELPRPRCNRYNLYRRLYSRYI